MQIIVALNWQITNQTDWNLFDFKYLLNEVDYCHSLREKFNKYAKRCKQVGQQCNILQIELYTK